MLGIKPIDMVFSSHTPVSDVAFICILISVLATLVVLTSAVKEVYPLNVLFTVMVSSAAIPPCAAIVTLYMSPVGTLLTPEDTAVVFVISCQAD